MKRPLFPRISFSILFLFMLLSGETTSRGTGTSDYFILHLSGEI
jgi:hypothetical protein